MTTPIIPSDTSSLALATYTSLDAVADHYPPGTPEHALAGVLFSQGHSIVAVGARPVGAWHSMEVP